ncbi:MAG: hydroxyacid dehydrogenase [bacterium]
MATKIGVLIPVPQRDSLFTPEDQIRLASLGEVHWNESAVQISINEACEFLADCEIGVGSWGTASPNAQLMNACPNLRLWEHVAGTVKRMFGPHLDGRDITIATCAPAIAENVAEMVIGELIIGLKRVLENAASNRCDGGGKPTNSRTLGNSTIGVIGASSVGRHLMRMLRPFGANVLLYDPFVTPADAALLGVQLRGNVTELCAECHAVTLHTPALPETEHMLGSNEFQAMQDDTVFINTSRGNCIDENALIVELEKGRLFAFLDVTDPEPAAPDSPLRWLPNVVYTLHIAGGPDAKLGRQAVDDIAAFLRGEEPLMAVRADMLARLA